MLFPIQSPWSDSCGDAIIKSSKTVETDSGGFATRVVWDLKPRAARFVKSAEYQRIGAGDAGKVINWAPAEPPQIVVTGIATHIVDKDVREAEFTYSWPEWKSEKLLLECFGGPASGSGTALFRHYDDGWRINRDPSAGGQMKCSSRSTSRLPRPTCAAGAVAYSRAFPVIGRSNGPALDSICVLAKQR